MNKYHNYSLGLVPSPADVRDFQIANDVACATALPEMFALPTPQVKNQGPKPTCVAHAGATIVEGFYMIQHLQTIPFSTEWIYGHRYLSFGDGMCLRDALVTLHKLGDVYETDCPGNHDVDEARKHVEEVEDALLEKSTPHRITRYFRATSINGMKYALFSHGYLLVSMNVKNGDYLSGNVWTTKDDDIITGAHAVVIYGWNSNGWLVQNSWGTGWGDQGRFIIPFDFKFNEVWGLEDALVEDESDFKKPFSTKIGKFFAKILNWFLNLFKKKK